MEDDLNFSKMEDNLNPLQYGRQPQSLKNGRLPQYFGKWKRPHFWQVEDHLNYDQLLKIIWKMEENLNIFSNGRPH
jgi:hypothetical protein